MVAKALPFQTIGFTTSPEKIPYLCQFVDEIRVLNFDDLSDLDLVIVMVAPKDGASYEETYLKTAQEIVQRMPKWVIYTSSTSVYGPGEVNEESSLLGKQVLIQTEQTFLSQESTILRLGGIYGEGRELKRKVNRIHCHDIVRAILFVIEHKLKGIYNICIPGTESDKVVSNDKIKESGFSFEYTH